MSHPYRDPPSCDHGVTFDEDTWREYGETQRRITGGGSDMPTEEVRKRWPRLEGMCPKGCGYNGIYYASGLHYVAGDW